MSRHSSLGGTVGSFHLGGGGQEGGGKRYFPSRMTLLVASSTKKRGTDGTADWPRSKINSTLRLFAMLLKGSVLNWIVSFGEGRLMLYGISGIRTSEKESRISFCNASRTAAARFQLTAIAKGWRSSAWPIAVILTIGKAPGWMHWTIQSAMTRSFIRMSSGRLAAVSAPFGNPPIQRVEGSGGDPGGSGTIWIGRDSTLTALKRGGVDSLPLKEVTPMTPGMRPYCTRGGLI